MDPTIAKSLISTLYNETLSQDDDHLILSSKVCNLFVSSLFSSQLILKNSLKGRISELFYFAEDKKDFEKKVRVTFALCLKTLKDQNDKASSAKEAFWRIRLYRELKNQDIFKSEGPKTTDYSTDHFDGLHDKILKDIEAKKTAESQKSYPLSFLRNAVKEQNPVNPLLLDEIFEDSEILSLEMLDYISNFLKANPEDTCCDYKIKLKALYEGCIKQKELDDRVLKDVKGNVQDSLKEEALSLATKMRQLKPGETFFFLGSYGKNDFNVKKLFSLIKLLPENLLAEIPSNIQDVIDNQDPETFVNELISAKVVNGMTEASSIIGHENVEFMKSLVDGSKIPKKLQGVISWAADQQTALKRNLLQHLSPLLKLTPSSEILDILSLIFENRDLLKSDQADRFCHFISILFQLLSYAPHEKTTDFIEEIRKNHHFITDPIARGQIQEKIEECIKSYLKPKMDLLKPIEKNLKKTFRMIQMMVPRAIQETIGFNEILSGGSFYVEFFKENNGSFTVSLYPSANAMGDEYKTRSLEHIQWPLTISDVSPDMMGTDLFYLLLRHHIEPKVDAQSVLVGKDLLQGVIELLSGYMEPNNESNTRQGLSDNQNTTAFCLNLLAKKNVSLNFPMFKMRFAAFINYCAPLMTENNKLLKIESEKDVQFLEKSLDQLTKDIVPHSQSFNPLFMDKFKSTIEEVQKAIEEFRFNKNQGLVGLEEVAHANPLNLPPFLIKVLKSTFHQFKIDAPFIKSYKATLCWAFETNDESETGISDLIDALAESVGQIPEVKSAPNDAPLNHTDVKISSIHQFLLDAYFQTALSALKIALKAARLYTQGVTPFFMYSFVSNGLRYVLPTQIVQWYNNVISLCLRKFVQTSLYVVFNLLLSKDDLQQIEAMKFQIRRLASDFVKKARYGDMISLDTIQEAASTVVKSMGPIELPVIEIDSKPSQVINKKILSFNEYRDSIEIPLFVRRVFDPTTINNQLNEMIINGYFKNSR